VLRLEADNHAKRLAKEGCEVKILEDASGVFAVRVVQESIGPANLGEFFKDALKDGLKIAPKEIDGIEYIYLT
jgi:hypothetical protein